MTDRAAASEETYGHLPDGREVKCFNLTNSMGLRARIMEYGAILISLEVPDREGRIADLTHGFETLDDWMNKNDPCFGASVGRFANRIAKGRFSLDGTSYELATNNQPGGIACHLHGGLEGFQKKLWKGRLLDDHSVELTLISADGEEGYPGTLRSAITYTLSDDNELIWEARATTDAPTVLNLVHHSYWNLSGDPRSSIDDHQLTLHASRYLPTKADLIPTGELAEVAGTPMDFTRARAIGESIAEDYEAIRFGNGYDHCWVLDETGATKVAARLSDPKTGRVMEILTNQPGIQFYSASFLDGSVAGKNGVAYAARSALCLETQNFPDAANQQHFPSPILRPGETYRHLMIHRFSTV